MTWRKQKDLLIARYLLTKILFYDWDKGDPEEMGELMEYVGTFLNRVHPIWTDPRGYSIKRVEDIAAGRSMA